MRHKIDGNRLGRDPEHRIAMMRNLVRSLVRHERIETTLARAKELRRDAEKIITLGKKGTLHARRQAFADLRDDELLRKVFSELAPRYADRAGGYTRIIKKGRRIGDDAMVAIIEYLPAEEAPKAAAEKAPKAKKAARPKDAVKEAVETAAKRAAGEAEAKAGKIEKSTKKGKKAEKAED